MMETEAKETQERISKGLRQKQNKNNDARKSRINLRAAWAPHILGIEQWHVGDNIFEHFMFFSNKLTQCVREEISQKSL